MSADSLTIERIAKDVQYLRDRQDILDCVSQYSRGVDRHDVDIITGAYHKDGIDEHGAVINDGSTFAQWVNERHDAHCHVHLHHITTHNCEIEGDVAHCESYVLFGLVPKDEKSVRLGGGRYVDRMERRNGAWRIAHRRCMIEWLMVGDNAVGELRARGFPAGILTREDDSYDRPLRLSPEARASFKASRRNI